MSAIWERDGSGWRLLSPSGFPDEATLHTLVEHAPHMLPLAGSPKMTIVGREVLLGGNYADLVAIESTGRLAIIEIKLARSAEARRAVIAQILTYAAFLRGMSPNSVEHEILRQHLKTRNFESLAQAASTENQDGSFDHSEFMTGVQHCLAEGRFRLILVLDEAPPELRRLVAYLEAVAEKLIIDLITVASFQVGETQLVVPQRVEAESLQTVASPEPIERSPTGHYVADKSLFVNSIDSALPSHQPVLRRLVDWASSLEAEGLVRLGSYLGTSGRITLLPRVVGHDAGLVTIWNDSGPYLSLWRSVFEKLAPESLAQIEQMPNAPKIAQGNTIKDFSESLLQQLTDAYREAARSRLST